MATIKDHISEQLVRCLANHLQAHLSSFRRSEFEQLIIPKLPALEFKQRVQLITDELHRILPADTRQRYRLITALLQPNVTEDRQSNEYGLSGWGTLPLCAVVGQYGQSAFKQSMEMLKALTPHFSAEFDVRYFLLADQSKALKILSTWVQSNNHHVRRLVSEGTRPRLPWAMQLPQLIADPTPVLPLLTALRDDSEEYVRRSVANHLNDIAKDHPDLVADLAHDWLKDATPERQKLIRHACRTLIKQGHPNTLAAFGLNTREFELIDLKLKQRQICLGETLDFQCKLRSTASTGQTLMIDYLLHFRKANGQQKPKVFKWKQITLAAGKTVELSRRHAIRSITTRRYYEGLQSLSLRINGQDAGWTDFELTC
ncbi:DNA alkylation repair protein [Gynuella sunshinyii]|uniref:DNA alkylation repair enzyme n=1 Tax=Gynuella sunshinyii YC6258 TaxID=1445510 RepID=A0A0C5VWT3_9GAMM|nr:DNA alkylation repair protein [Gynuella sunshinyii]AJQ94914.1 DNA alkylation repair enzyme [Gynuella sunshinyii YC6258]